MQPTSEPPYPPGSAATTVRTARPWLVAVTAFLSLLVLVAAIGNQWATDRIAKQNLGSGKFSDNALIAATTYQWRFAPRGGHDVARQWSSGLAFVATTLVLTMLLVAAVARGKGGFWQAFLGSWMAVIVATMLATYVRALVLDTSRLGVQKNGKANVVFFSTLSGGSDVLAASVGFGFVVAIIAGFTAIASRRTTTIGSPMPYPPPEPVEPPPSPSEPWPAPPAMAQRPTSAADDDGSQHTAVLPVIDAPRPVDRPPEASEHTQRLPRKSYGSTETSDASGTEPTTELPRADSRTDDPAS